MSFIRNMSLLVAGFYVGVAAVSAAGWRYDDAQFESKFAEKVHSLVNSLHNRVAVAGYQANHFTSAFDRDACAMDKDNLPTIRAAKYQRPRGDMVDWLETYAMQSHDASERLDKAQMLHIKGRIEFWAMVEFCRCVWANSPGRELNQEQKKALAKKMFNDDATSLIPVIEAGFRD